MMKIFPLLAITFFLVACSSANQDLQWQQHESGVRYKTVTPGTGDVAKQGDKVTVHYIGTLEDGTEFDNSYKQNKGFTFTLGRKEVIEGWEIGVEGMKVGEKRQLVIPPSLAYGDRSIGRIPPNSTLVFTVELLDVK